MQQAIGTVTAPIQRTDRDARVSRQARVGIIANTNEVALPVHAPREIWVRWPKLRSARRREGQKGPDVPPPLAQDPILSGSALHDFTREIRLPGTERSAPPASPDARGFSIEGMDPPEILPPGQSLHPIIRIGLSVLMLALGAIGVSMLMP